MNHLILWDSNHEFQVWFAHFFDYWLLNLKERKGFEECVDDLNKVQFRTVHLYYQRDKQINKLESKQKKQKNK